MLREVSQCRNFMDFNKMVKLLQLIKDNSLTINEIKKYFNEDAVVLRNIDDTIILLRLLEIMDVDDEVYKVSDRHQKFDKEYIIHNLLLSIIEKKLVEFSNIDNDCFLSIDYNFYALRNLLLSENIIMNYPIRSFYILNSEYTSGLIPFMKKKISKRDLIEKLEKQDEYGEQAELFVIDYEKNLLNGKSSIVHVALEDAGAGYDIKSYLNEDSKSHNKFIEVKCFSLRSGKFFISKNEVEVSKKLGDSYFLYLVESNFIRKPYIIQNPYKKIFNNSEINGIVESWQYDIPEIMRAIKDEVPD